MESIVIIGAGDGGRIVSQLIKGSGKFKVIGFLDDDEKLQGKTINGYQVIGGTADLNKFSGSGFVVAIGKNTQMRSRLFDLAVNAGLSPVSLIDKSVVIDESAEVGDSAIILANTVIGPFSKIGKNVFIFSGTIIEHDSQVGDNVYFSPGVSLAGRVKVGNNTFFGINSCVIEGITIGSKVVVGAGSVVLDDVPDSTVVAGVPAKVLRKNDR